MMKFFRLASLSTLCSIFLVTPVSCPNFAPPPPAPSVSGGTNTHISLSAGNVTVGTSVTVTVNVNALDSTTVTSGTVSVVNGPTTLPIRAVSAGVATFTFTPQTIGTYHLSAIYSGSSSYSGSVSSPTTLTVTAASGGGGGGGSGGGATISTTTGISLSAFQVVQGSNVTITVYVHTSSGASITGGTVSISGVPFSVPTISISNGTGSATVVANTAGTFAVVATYSGNSTYLTSTSIASTLVVQSSGGTTPPVSTTTTFLTVLSSVQPYVGQTLQLDVRVTASNGSSVNSGTVSLLNGPGNPTPVTVANGLASLRVLLTSAGSFNMSAAYSGVSGNPSYNPSVSSSLAITVTAAPVTPPPPGYQIPSYAVSSGYLDGNTKWVWNHDPGTPGSSSGSSTYPISSPSLTGLARKYAMTYSSSGGEIYHVSFGLDTTSHYFVYDLWLYSTDYSHEASMELDMNQVLANGGTVIFGIQCSRYSGTWEYTYTNTGSHWHTGTIPCAPQKWVPNVWHHIQLASHRDDSGNAYYDWVNYDGVYTNFNNAVTHDILFLGWQKGDLLINFQIDGYQSSGAVTLYANKVQVWRW